MLARFIMQLPEIEALGGPYLEYTFCENYEKRIIESIDNHILKDEIDINSLGEEWFPEIDSFIFVSHSHDDVDIVKDLAEYLYREYRITCFIDSTIWNRVDELKRLLDIKYKDNAYRNESLAYILLQSALLKMIDHCECFIFVSSPQSIKKSEDKTSNSTGSIWIYNEVLTASKIRLKSLEESRNDTLSHSNNGMKLIANLDLQGFSDLSLEDFKNARNSLVEYEEVVPEFVLDNLYRSKGFLTNELQIRKT